MESGASDMFGVNVRQFSTSLHLGLFQSGVFMALESSDCRNIVENQLGADTKVSSCVQVHTAVPD